MTDDHFTRATGKAVQNPVHSDAVTGLQRPSDENETAVSPAFAKDTAVQIPPRGVEEEAYFPKNNRKDRNGDTISDTDGFRQVAARRPEPTMHLDGLPAEVRDQLRGLSADMVAKIRQLLATVEPERRGS